MQTASAGRGLEEFWQAVEISNDISAIETALSLTLEDLEAAQSKLDNLKESARRQRRMIQVCGAEFDSSEDNLSNLWHHICYGIGDDSLEALSPLNLTDSSSLKKVGIPPKRSHGGQKPPLVAKRKGRLSRSMEELIGLAGEIHAFRMLQKTYGAHEVHQASWVSNNSTFVFPDNRGDDSRGCDFVIHHKNRIYHIEVKATEGDDDTFRMGSSEIRLAMALAKRKRNRREVFLVLHVTKALSQDPSFRLLPNPYDPRYQPYFVVEDADTRVRYRCE